MTNEQQDPEQRSSEDPQDGELDLVGEELDGVGTVFTESSPGLEELLIYLRDARGFDFSGYKRAGLARRLGKRMQALKLNAFLDYVDYLQVHPDEFATLFTAF
jgi:hypothetical protein